MAREHVGTQKSRQTRQKTTEKFGQVRFSSYLCTVQRNEGLAEAPHFIYINVYDRQDVVKRLVEEWLAGKEYFLVDVQVGTDDRIVVEIDHADGVWVDDCADLSRYIEDHLSRDEEDYELEVGSTGLGQPFKVPQQYVNNIGNEVEVLTQDGKKVKGTLKAVETPRFTVSVPEKVKVEGKKRPVMMDVDYDYDMNEVKYTKYIISFK